MKIFGALLFFWVFPATAGNYLLTIDGKTIEIDLDNPTELTLSKGQSTKIVLSQKKTQLWRDDLVEFEHSTEYPPSQSMID